MPKGKKKKQKNEDFKKVKLKVGKSKLSAANSTDVSFKSQSINILSQLEEKDEPTNRRNLSLKVAILFTDYQKRLVLYFPSLQV